MCYKSLKDVEIIEEKNWTLKKLKKPLIKQYTEKHKQKSETRLRTGKIQCGNKSVTNWTERYEKSKTLENWKELYVKKRETSQ